MGIFGWRVATNTLATKKNKCRRTIVVDATCNICGNGVEDEYHAVIFCTKSRAVREAMREEWNLPKENAFWHPWEDWLFVLMDSVPEDMRAKIILLLWRSWHLRDDCTFRGGSETIRSSVLFLLRYVEELKCAELSEGTDTGKNACMRIGQQAGRDRREAMHWTARYEVLLRSIQMRRLLQRPIRA